MRCVWYKLILIFTFLSILGITGHPLALNGSKARALSEFQKPPSSGPIPALNLFEMYRRFGNTSNDLGYGVYVDTAGNTYLSGYMGLNAYDWFLTKFNVAGDQQWNITWNSGDEQYDYCYGMVADNTSNLFLTGSSGAYPYNATILKLDSSGALIYNETLNVTNTQFANGIAVDNLGCFYITGRTENLTTGNWDGFVAKFADSGNAATLIWTRTWGGSQIDNGKRIALDGSGDLYVVGEMNALSLDWGSPILLKFNATDGVPLWNVTWGYQFDQANDVAVDPQGGITVAGINATGGFNAFVAKFNATGSQLWNTTWGTASNAYAITFDPVYNITYVGGRVGEAGDAVLLLAFDPMGNLLFNQSWQGPYSPNMVNVQAIALNGTDHIFLAGKMDIVGSGSNWDAFFVKFSTNPPPALVNKTADFSYVYRTTGNAISWNITGLTILQSNYTVTRNGSEITNGSWTSGVPITILVDDLAVGSYTFMVNASNGRDLYINDSVQVTVTPNTSPMFNLSTNAGSPNTNGYFTLNWTSATNATNYSVYTHGGYIADINESVQKIADQIPGFSFSITGVGSGDFFYKIMANYPDGNTTSNCIHVLVLVPPGSFTLTSNAGIPERAGTFNLTWTVSAQASNYSVYWYSSFITAINVSVTLLANQILASTYPVTDFPSGVYYFVVVGNNATGSTMSNNLLVSVQILPGSFILTSNAANPQPNGTFILSWTTAANADYYILYWAVNPITDISATDVHKLYQGQLNEYVVSQWMNGTTYFVAVAFNAYGNTSTASLTVNVNLPGVVPGGDWLTQVILYPTLGAIVSFTVGLLLRRAARRRHRREIELGVPH